MVNTIIFGFENVFQDIDFHVTIEELKKLGLNEWNQEFEGIKNKLEKGKMTEVQFMIEVKKLIPNAQIEDIRKAWYAQLGEFPLKRLEFLQKISHRYKLYLIGNFDEILYTKFEHQVGGTFAREFYQCFAGVYFSHEIKIRKPDPEAIKFVLKKNGLTAKRTLFVDIDQVNIETARELGMETWHLNTQTEKITDLLQIKEEVL